METRNIIMSNKHIQWQLGCPLATTLGRCSFCSNLSSIVPFLWVHVYQFVTKQNTFFVVLYVYNLPRNSFSKVFHFWKSFVPNFQKSFVPKHTIYHAIYWVTQKLPQTYTANDATFPIRLHKITVQICGNFWVTQYYKYHEQSRCVCMIMWMAAGRFMGRSGEILTLVILLLCISSSRYVQ